jgi:hypothetical protein
MDPAGVLTAAEAYSDAASDAVRAVIKAEYLKFTEAELLSFAQTFETHARLVFTAQVRLAGEIDGRKMAAAHGASSTSALLRETLTISQPDARTRVTTAAATLPQPAVSGGTIDPVLPLLGAALADGEIGVEQTRTIVTTMTRLPAAVDPQLRDDVQDTLVEHGILTEPKPLASAVKLDAVPGRSRRRATRTANSTNGPTRTRWSCISAPVTPAPG